MPEFRLVAHPTVSPTRCFMCQDHQGPMIDTMIDDPNSDGRIYVCVGNDKRAGCLNQMARLAGFAENVSVQPLLDELAAVKEEMEALKATSFNWTIADFQKAGATANPAHGHLTWSLDE
jgi:hypothetical protein